MENSFRAGSKGAADGQFKHPEGIAIDSSGNIYVVDKDNNRVEKFEITVNSSQSGVPLAPVTVSLMTEKVLLWILQAVYTYPIRAIIIFRYLLLLEE